MAQKPLWRRAFDGVERRVAGPMETGVQSELFADSVALLVRAQNRLTREVQDRTATVLALANLPAGSDVKQLSRQVASLERHVRELSKQLEDERAAAGATGGARPRTRAAAGGRRSSGGRGGASGRRGGAGRSNGSGG